MTTAPRSTSSLSPPLDTLTGWFTAAGTLLAANRRTRELAGWVLLVVGFGGLGVAWERAAHARISQFRWDREAADSALRHVPQIVAGVIFVHGHRR